MKNKKIITVLKKGANPKIIKLDQRNSCLMCGVNNPDNRN
jgi:hypothetical protein